MSAEQTGTCIMRITKAVIPAAGFGTRLYPATRLPMKEKRRLSFGNWTELVSLSRADALDLHAHRVPDVGCQSQNTASGRKWIQSMRRREESR